MSADKDVSFLSATEIYPLLGRRCAGYYLPERSDPEPVAGLEDPSRIREVLVGQSLVIVPEPLVTSLTECYQPMAGGHRNLAEIHKRDELFGDKLVHDMACPFSLGGVYKQIPARLPKLYTYKFNCNP